MAASTKSHARICLTFDSKDVESSWLLVKYKEMPLIHDVCQKINSQYSLVRSRKKQLVLRLQSSILPNWESSELLQNDDRISVSVEKLHRSNDKPLENNQVIAPKERGTKRRRQETPTEHLGDPEPEEKRKKGIALETSQTARSDGENIKDLQKVKSSAAGYVGYGAADQISHETIQDNSGEMETMQVESNTDEKHGINSDNITSETCIATKKRKRIRKHRKKKATNGDECDRDDSIDRVANIYKGRDIGRDELFFGCIPDKLVSPKYYRHEYRNLNVYKPEPSKHTKFDSDEEVDSRENTEQYNFLSSTKLLEEREAYKDAKEHEKEENDSSVLNLDNSMQTSEIPCSPSDEKQTGKIVNHNDTGFGEEKEGENVCTTGLKISDPVKKIDTEVCNGYHSDTVKSNGYNDFPFKYPSSEPRSIRKVMNPAPHQLTRKTLSNGASVFVRQRPGRKQQESNYQFEMSKEDQLNTVATNISTIFVNPVKTSDDTKEKASIHSNENKKDNPTATTISQSVFDYSKLPPLKGELKKGDKIVYKILEISETCTPEISDFREAVVMSVDKNQMVELKNLTSTEAKKNIFHIEIEDEHEVLTNTASSQGVVQLHLSSLLDIRVVESC